MLQLQSLGRIASTLCVLAGPSLAQVSWSIPSHTGQPDDHFGQDVALDGNWLVVGAHEHDNVQGVKAGAAFVYEFDGVSWNLSQQLVGSATIGTSHFGYSVAIEGTRLVVGARRNPGSVYVFELQGSTWIETHRLTAVNGQFFGRDLALEGDRLAVATNFDGSYVFDYDAPTDAWIQIAHLAHGQTVALDGNRMIGGTFQFTMPLGAEIYEDPGGGWGLFEALSTTLTEEVQLHGSFAFLGDWVDNGSDGDLRIFEERGGVWTEVAVHADSGRDVECVGNRAVIGGFGLTVFDLLAGVWTPVWTFGSQYGRSVAFDGSRVAAGRSNVLNVGVFELDCNANGILDNADILSGVSVDCDGNGVPDECEYSSVATYCTGKTSTQGCLPTLSSCGLPSVGSLEPFLIDGADIVALKNGITFYGLSGAIAVPFQGATLCVAPPLRRTTLQNSGGAPPCGGTLSIDFNQWIQSGVDPLLVPGADVHAQQWFREPADAFGSGLTDAIGFEVMP